MNGLELSRRYYMAFGEPMLREQFAEWVPYLAVGLCGAGSENLGFDDAVSEDHDFGPGFCIFLPGEDVVDRKTAFRLERAYAALPAEFEGYRRPVVAPVGGARTGVLRMADFFLEKTGSASGMLSAEQWLSVPYASLGEAVNGEVFADPSGVLTGIREQLKQMPEDIRRKRLAGHLLLMAQSGQYNYQRCLDHGEEGAAQLAAFDFVRNAISAVFLLNRRYEPFYKWAFRAMRGLPVLSDIEKDLTEIISTPNDPQSSFEKYNTMESVAASVISVLMDQGLTEAVCGDLEKHAYSVNDGIGDGNIRNMHILSGV
ncbi:MAG: DUF4037 domain-containing protein [Clostridia bacterium]|jgi:hypothetical protein|nr:DUF4037 domain-containing protein [Clostridia bacterium]